MDALCEHAEAILSVALKYAGGGHNMAHAAMAGSRQFVELAHYPRHDVVDAGNRSRYFYHAHDSRRRPVDEHGHFHVFCHGRGRLDYFHLVGVSLNQRGLPTRLFTTNRWVTGERWRGGAEITRRLDTFEIHARGRMAPVARWITAMIHLYGLQIKSLVEQRDALMAQRAQSETWEHLFENRQLDVVSQKRINLESRIRQLACP